LAKGVKEALKLKRLSFDQTKTMYILVKRLNFNLLGRVYAKRQKKEFLFLVSYELVWKAGG
jgi:hypothetical protein